MGGGTEQESYVDITLDQPWGEETKQVRIFPPCQIKAVQHRGDPVVVFVKAPRGAIWKRKRIGYFDYFPSTGFVAWDDKNQEYAWHEVGTIDAPNAKDPDIKRRQSVVRPDPSPQPEPRARGQRKGWFQRWWTSLANNDQDLDFLKDR